MLFEVNFLVSILNIIYQRSNIPQKKNNILLENQLHFKHKSYGIELQDRLSSSLF